MHLKITRTQKAAGRLSKAAAIFCIDARVEFTPAEKANIKKYDMGHQIIYSSEAAKKHQENAALHGQAASVMFDVVTGAGLGRVLMGGLKSVASGAMAMFSLNISIDSLQNGQHIECKDLIEVMAAEQALKEACENLKAFIDTAATFDGREQLWGFENGTAEVVAETTAPDPTLIIDPSGGGKGRPLSFGGDEVSPGVLVDMGDEPALSQPVTGGAFALPPPMPKMDGGFGGDDDLPFPPPGHLPGPTEPEAEEGGSFVAPIRIREKPKPKFFG